MLIDPFDGIDRVGHCSGIGILGGEPIVEAYGEAAVFY